MYRELMFKSAKLSATGRGMVYICLFLLASLTYVIIINMPVAFLSMVTLSFIAIIASILSDRRTLYQYVSVLIFSGAKKRIILFCIRIYTSLRIAMLLTMFTIILAYFGYYIYAFITGLTYVLFIVFLPYILYKVFKR